MGYIDSFRKTDKGMNSEDPKIIQNKIIKGKNAKEMKEGKGREEIKPNSVSACPLEAGYWRMPLSRATSVTAHSASPSHIL